MYALASIKFRDVALRQSLLDTGQSPLMECVKSREGYWSGTTTMRVTYAPPPQPMTMPLLTSLQCKIITEETVANNIRTSRDTSLT